MTIFQEFKKFIGRGNVLDLAVGVLIGAAFGKIVTALTESILMPILGWLFGDIDFSNHFIRLGRIPASYTGGPNNYVQLKQAGVAMIGYGDFLTQLVNFLIVAAAMFLLIKSINKLSEAIEVEKKHAESTAEAKAVPTDPQLDVLRDILAELRASRAGSDRG